jgi:hypothetical protein
MGGSKRNPSCPFKPVNQPVFPLFRRRYTFLGVEPIARPRKDNGECGLALGANPGVRLGQKRRVGGWIIIEKIREMMLNKAIPKEVIMMDLMGYIKRRKEGKLQKAEKEIEAVRLAFTQRYLNFKSLLSTNDKVLEIINELEQALQGRRGFGMSFVRGNCTALSVNLYKIIQNLNAITANRYPELFEVFQGIWEKIDRELKHKKTVNYRKRRAGRSTFPYAAALWVRMTWRPPLPGSTAPC